MKLSTNSLFLFLLLFISNYVFANDGVFYASGNHLIPATETDIILKKEVLKLHKKADRMYVDVYYEFQNTGKEKTILVGFVTPPGSGDLEDEKLQKQEHEYIYDFTVNINDQALAYKTIRLDTNGFKSPLGAAPQDDIYSDYAYYFNATFKSGINVIKHTYSYQLSGSVEHEYSFDYRLTTGKSWANKEIEDFTLIISSEEMTDIFVPSTFYNHGEKIKWEEQGKMKEIFLDKKMFEYLEIDYNYYLLHPSSSLTFKAKNFKPDYDIFCFSMQKFMPEYAMLYYNMDVEKIDEKTDFISALNLNTDYCDFKAFSDFELRILRNYVFARHGYIFKDTVLQNYFSKMYWYLPDSNTVSDESILTTEEKKLLDLVKKEEENRKK